MIVRRWLAGVALGLMLVSSSVALAFAPNTDARDFEIPLPQFQMLQAPSQHYMVRGATDVMRQNYGGNWHVVQFNQFTNTPEDMYGSGVQLASDAVSTDARAVETTLEFVTAHPEVLGAEATNLTLNTVRRARGKVVVHMTQQYRGIPVIGGRVRVGYSDTGRLFFLGSSFYGDIDVNPVPFIGEAQARSIATTALSFDLATDEVRVEPQLAVLPVPLEEGGAEHHLVWRSEVFTDDPYGIWVTDVDAHTGEILHRYNDVHSIYSGTQQGVVDIPTYCDGQSTLPLREMTVEVTGQGSTVTASDGTWSLGGGAGTQTMTVEFDGPQQNVVNFAGNDATETVPIDDNSPLVFDWDDSNSTPGERDTFYWINETDAFVKTLDPTYNHPKYTCNVNRPQTCNANWGGNVMNFFDEGGGCANTSRLGDVNAHEFGHGLLFDLVGDPQANEGLGEGNGDILGSMMSNESVIGRGFFLGNCVSGIRDCDNTLIYPDDAVGQEVHDAGRVICGFHWDMWQELEAQLGASLGLMTSAQIWYDALNLFQPFNQPAQVLAYFMADDDDVLLENGTPHYDAICLGATNHNYECPEIISGVIVQHTGLMSTTSTAARSLTADVFSTVGNVTNVDLLYQIDGAGFTQVAMTNTGGDTYEGTIPASATGCVVEYYVLGEDDQANTGTSPQSAPTNVHRYAVATDILTLEQDTGWTVGAAGDNAVTGIWERINPVGTLAQPEDDHSAVGTLAFVTGQCGSGGGTCGTGCTLGCNDVDGGTTTLTSPIWDFSSATQSAWIFYWRWYSNNTGASPNADNWVVDVSNDGGATWTNVETVNPPNDEQAIWLRTDINLTALFGTPNQVRLRFRASDLSSGSIVEAAVDDIVLAMKGASAGIDGPASPTAAANFAVHDARPNPFNPATSISYDVPSDGHVTMEIFDIHGRSVRTLVDGFVESGSHTVRWDGRNDNNAPVASGVYHLTVTSGDEVATRKLTLLSRRNVEP